MNRTFRIDPKIFLQGVSPGLFSTLRNQRIRVLRDATQLWYNSHNSHSILVVIFSSFVRIVAFLWLFVWLFINLMMREQTLMPGFATRFRPVESTLGWMPIFTRSSRAGTLSRKYLHGCRRMAPWLLLPCELLFLDTLRPRVIDGSESVAAFGVGFCA